MQPSETVALTHADKARIAAVLNQHYRTSLSLELFEVAIEHGSTTWRLLRDEAMQLETRHAPRSEAPTSPTGNRRAQR